MFDYATYDTGIFDWDVFPPQPTVVPVPALAYSNDLAAFAARGSIGLSGQNWSGAGYMNIYEIDTQIQINGEFRDALNRLYIDPSGVTLFVLDPSGLTTAYMSTIVRDSVGHYHQQITPGKSGTWTYKWQGTGAAIATSPDTTFTVNASALIPG